jgi:hypothetical protein
MNKYRPDPTPVLNAVVSPDTVVMAQLTQTIFFTDHRNASTIIKDADLTLYINGEMRSKMTYDDKTSMYVTDVIPASGDTVKIVASTSFGQVEGTDIVPQKIKISSLKISGRLYNDKKSIIYSPSGVSYVDSYEVRYSITFTDPLNQKNYYCIRIENEAKKGAMHIDYSYDDIFVAQESLGDTSNDEGRTFDDSLINGATYTMTIFERFQYYCTDGDKMMRRVILYSLSEGYYKYLTGILNTGDGDMSDTMVNWGFAEPAAHYSNIIGGTGIVAAVNTSYRSIDINKVLYKLSSQ